MQMYSLQNPPVTDKINHLQFIVIAANFSLKLRSEVRFTHRSDLLIGSERFLRVQVSSVPQGGSVMSVTWVRDVGTRGLLCGAGLRAQPSPTGGGAGPGSPPALLHSGLQSAVSLALELEQQVTRLHKGTELGKQQ